MGLTSGYCTNSVDKVLYESENKSQVVRASTVMICFVSSVSMHISVKDVREGVIFVETIFHVVLIFLMI